MSMCVCAHARLVSALREMGSSIQHPPEQPAQNSLFHLFDLRNLCLLKRKKVDEGERRNEGRGLREEKKRGVNELSLPVGWAQCFYYLKLTGCEAIHSQG